MKNFVFLSVFSVLIFTLSSFVISDAHATSYELQSGDANGACEAIGGTWDSGQISCTIINLTLNQVDSLIIGQAVILVNSGTIDNLGTINNSGIINNTGGTINNSGGTINNQCGAAYSGNIPVGNQVNLISCPASTLTLDSIHHVPWGKSITVKGKLLDTKTGKGIGGAAITFDADGASGLSSVTTTSNGKFTVSGASPSTSNSGWHVQAHFAGDFTHKSSDSAIKQYYTTKHTTSLSLTLTPSTVIHGGLFTITTMLQDTTTITRIASKTITFTAISPITIASMITDGTGTATSGLTAPQETGNYGIVAHFTGDFLYNPKDSVSKTLSVASQSPITSITTGIAKYDQFDTLIIDAVNKYGFPDALVIKAVEEDESFFDPFSVSTDTPCGIPSGWTSAQSRSYGLLQITPTCDYQVFLNKGLLLSTGKPNLITYTTSPLWATSVFNPTLNIDFAVDDIKSEYDALKLHFPGCTEKQYIRMTLSSYNSGADSVLGCGLYNARGTNYVNLVVDIYNNELGPLVGTTNKI